VVVDGEEFRGVVVASAVDKILPIKEAICSQLPKCEYEVSE
jgi:hypothetical protein